MAAEFQPGARARQEKLRFPNTWGGKRKGAGRKRAPGKRRSVAHRQRPRLPSRFPVHVTMRMRPEVRYLRRFKLCRELWRCLARASKDGFRVCQVSLQSNHLHLVCEARGALALSRGMQGLSVRVARAINRVRGRRGTVLADRYHAEQLRTPRQVRNALAYVLHNGRRHGAGPHRGGETWIDPFSSARFFDGWARHAAALARDSGPPPDDLGPPVAPARSWLLTEGWRRYGLIRAHEVPGGGRR